MKNFVSNTFRGLYALSSFAAIVYKGDEFSDCSLAILHTKLLLERGLL